MYIFQIIQKVAKEYAGPDGVIMGFAANKPIGGKRSIIDKNMGYAGGQTQYVLSPKEAIEFMKNPNFQMGFPIFSDPTINKEIIMIIEAIKAYAEGHIAKHKGKRTYILKEPSWNR